MNSPGKYKSLDLQVARDGSGVGAVMRGVEGFDFLIKYLQRLRYNALYLDAAAQAGCSLAGSDCFAPAAAVYANMAVSTNHTTIHYKLLDTIAQEKSLQRNC